MPSPLGDAVLQAAGRGVIQIQLPPVLFLGKPDDLVAGGQIAPVHGAVAHIPRPKIAAPISSLRTPRIRRPSKLVSSTTTSSGTRKIRVARQRVRQVESWRKGLQAQLKCSIIPGRYEGASAGRRAGTRLRPLTIHAPKSIVPIFNRPFLHYQLDYQAGAGDRRGDPQPQLPAAPHRRGLWRRPRGRHQDPLRRGADAARHGGAVRFAARAWRHDRGVQRRRADAGRSRRADRLSSRARGQGHHRADAGRQSHAPTASSRPTQPATSCDSSRSQSPTRSPATRSTRASTSWSRTRSIAFPKNIAWSIERSFFPSFIERGETFIACDLSRLLDRHRHAGKVHAGAPRHHGRTLHGAPFNGSRAWPGCRRERAGRQRREPRRPALRR